MRRALTGLLLVLGCVEDDPSFVEPEGTTSGAEAGTSTSASVGDGGTREETGDADVGDADTGETGASCSPPYVVLATVADCRGQGQDPNKCEELAGVGNLLVDTSGNFSSFLRFEVDPALSDASITAARVELEVTGDPQAHSDSTGELWLVEPFTRDDLFTIQPLQIGDEPIGPDRGSVIQGDRFGWDLDIDIIQPGASLFLGVFPVTGDSVKYWNLHGDRPPRLVVDCE